MNYRPIITNKSIIFNLVKPLYGSFFGIWDKWLQYPYKHIVVNTPFGKATFKNAADYKKQAKRIERYYKNPNEPMIFYGMSFLPLIKEREERKKEEEAKEKVDIVKAGEQLHRLAEMARKKCGRKSTNRGSFAY